MIRIGPVSIALMGAIVVNVFFALLLPTAAQATCSGIWEASGQWSAVQSNGATPKFQILNTPTGLRGSAEYYAGVGYLQQLVHGSADGAISRDNFQLTVYWENGSKGVYTG